MIDNFKTRLLEEQASLRNRGDKLAEFLTTPYFHNLSEEDQEDLDEQLKHMIKYLKVLNRRVSRL